MTTSGAACKEPTAAETERIVGLPSLLQWAQILGEAQFAGSPAGSLLVPVGIMEDGTINGDLADFAYRLYRHDGRQFLPVE